MKDIKRDPIWCRVKRKRVQEFGLFFKRFFHLDSIKKKYVMPLGKNRCINSQLFLDISFSIRGCDYSPSIMIHGVMPRSGTNYLADLMSYHKLIKPFPHRFWEFPLLASTEKIAQLQDDFASIYKKNSEVLEPFEFAGYLNSGMMKYLQNLSGSDKIMLFKFPYIDYVAFFRDFFPRDYLILVLRDGRDVVQSSIKTFKDKKGIFGYNFTDYCREWNYAAQIILKYERGEINDSRAFVVRYEELYADPEKVISMLFANVDKMSQSLSDIVVLYVSMVFRKR